MALRCSRLVLVALSWNVVSISAFGTSVRLNPIRKVVNMLERMRKNVEEEGRREEELYKKFECFCKSGSGSLKKSIADAETKIPALESGAGEVTGELAQLRSTVEQQKKDRTSAKNDEAEAVALREKEAQAYAEESAEKNANIASIAKAIKALEKGVSGSFLQTQAAETLRKLLANIDMDSSDRNELGSFLQQGAEQGAGYAPQSGEIIGILKQLKETMEGDLAEATATEQQAIKSFMGLQAAKKKEVAALTTSIEEKLTRIGDAGLELVNMKKDLKDTSGALEQDKRFLADLENNCGSKKKDWAEREKARASEVVAIQETIKLLNDDDALELFKKTLPSASLVQLAATSKELRQRSRSLLAKERSRGDFRVDFISLALRGKHAGFDKVLTMIDEMTSLLGKEAALDEKKKEYCESTIDTTEDKHKELTRKVSDLESYAADTNNAFTTLAEEIATLEASVRALDKQVGEATTQRKEEHAEYVETMAANNAASKLLALAKNRLNLFYNPKLAQPAPVRELAADDQIVVNMGGTAPPTPAPGGVANTGITYLETTKSDEAFAFVQESSDPGRAPETWSGNVDKKGQESAGVIAMIDMLVKDIAKDMQIAEVEEKDAQADYETLMKESAEKRGADAKMMTVKEGAKAESEATMQATDEKLKSKKQEVLATLKSLHSTHSDCDWLLQNFEVRDEARVGEVESLKKAKAVLSGADYSFLQTRERKIRSPTRKH
jgi:hypothetical protein